MGDQQFGIDAARLNQYSKEIKTVKDLGTEIAIVIGGGNIFRGVDAERSGIDRIQGDYMGMLATVINGMALQSNFEDHGMYTRLLELLVSLTFESCYIVSILIINTYK